MLNVFCSCSDGPSSVAMTTSDASRVLTGHREVAASIDLSQSESVVVCHRSSNHDKYGCISTHADPTCGQRAGQIG